MKENYTKYSLLKLSYDKTLICASGICVKRDIFESFNFPSKVEIGEDIYFWQKILLNEGFACWMQNYAANELIQKGKYGEFRFKAKDLVKMMSVGQARLARRAIIEEEGIPK